MNPSEQSDRNTPVQKSLLVVLDFDGFMLNSYALLRGTFEYFGLDVGDEARFQNRRKFLKYFGGGKELLGNMVKVTLPKKGRIRQILTDEYREKGRLYEPFVPFIGRLIEEPRVHVGIVSRNYTLEPGRTIRRVLHNSGVAESELDFVIPIPIGVKKQDILEGMHSTRYHTCILGADEIGDYRAALETGYEAYIASYGFDHRARLEQGGVPGASIHDSPAELVRIFEGRVAAHFDRHAAGLI